MKVLKGNGFLIYMAILIAWCLFLPASPKKYILLALGVCMVIIFLGHRLRGSRKLVFELFFELPFMFALGLLLTKSVLVASVIPIIFFWLSCGEAALRMLLWRQTGSADLPDERGAD